MTQNQVLSEAVLIRPARPRDYRKTIFWIAGAMVLLAYYLAGLPLVPFHPDESTWIYMSADWDRMITEGPLSIAWSPAGEMDPLQVERERAAPLTREVIGLARGLFGRSATPVDWDWSASWETNAQRGALPDPDLLLIARLPQAIFLWLTTLLLARFAAGVAGGIGAAAAALAFGLDGQVLLHARHAMSESLLLFGIALAAVAARELARRKTRPWCWAALAGCAVAVAVSAKYSGALAATVAAAGLILSTPWRPVGAWARRCGLHALIAMLAGLLGFAIMNPFYWSNPLAAASSVIRARDEFQAQQVLAIQQAEPGWVLQSISMRALGLAYEAFFAPPSFWDIPNYADTTRTSVDAYLASLWSGLPAAPGVDAAICLVILIGLMDGIRRWRIKNGRRLVLITWLWSATTAGGLLVFVPILWQRYYLPMIPLLSIWAGVGMAAVIKGIIHIWKVLFSETGESYFKI